MPPVTVVALHVAPEHRVPMRPVDAVEAVTGRGLVGDRFFGTRHRHVTVQAADDLERSAVVLGRPVPPPRTRRNVTVSRGPVPSTPGELVRIGDVELEVVRIAAPCVILDRELGPGAQAALRRRAGTVFRLLRGGTIRLGDAVDLGPPRDDRLF